MINKFVVDKFVLSLLCYNIMKNYAIIFGRFVEIILILVKAFLIELTMETYAFIGPSGTGKSHHAIFVAEEHHIDLIIDDGLLIRGSRILAGVSAKRSPTRIGAIKTALFSDKTHAAEVHNKIFQTQPQRILILGTSLGMVEKIAVRLNLPQPQVIINIEDVVTPDIINKARYIREHAGSHVVPAPTVEVKQRFSGNFFRPIKSFFQRKNPGTHPLATKDMWVDQAESDLLLVPWASFISLIMLSSKSLNIIV